MKYIKCSRCGKKIYFKEYAYVDDCIAGIFCSLICYARTMQRYDCIEVNNKTIDEHEDYEHPIKIYKDKL